MTIIFPHLGRAGRLGNCLWQVASTFGIAAKYGDVALFPPGWEYRQYLSIPDENFGAQVGVDASTLVPHIDPRARVYLQDFSLFADIEDTVRGYLSPHGSVKAMLADSWVQSVPAPRIGLHVRRGDNVTHPLGWHPLRSVDYYREAVSRLPSEATVIVFSDDIPWCSQNLPTALDRDCLFFEGVTRPREYEDRQAFDASPVLDWIDLFLMASLEYLVISNSSYSWWAAELSDAETIIYPDNWYGYHLNYIDWRLMIPPQDRWVEIHDETQGGV